MYVLVSRTEAGQLSKSRKKILATTYKHFSESLYVSLLHEHRGDDGMEVSGEFMCFQNGSIGA